MREGRAERETSETHVSIVLRLDGAGQANISTCCGFLDHMLNLMAHHGRFDLRVETAGDTQVDDHHITEDVGITLGMAFKQALGNARGIKRYASVALPMDESLVLCALDVSGRTYVNCDVALPAAKVGTFDTELVSKFFWGFTRTMPMTIHFVRMAGGNTHHLIEAMFKGFGRALREALSVDVGFADEVPSSKGVL